MDASLTDVRLCSRALLVLGANTIASFGEDTTEVEVASNLYPGVRDALLAGTAWSFATRARSLAELAQVPTVDYAHAYQLPSDCLRPLSLGGDGQGDGLAYRIQGGQVHSDAEPPVILRYLARVPESAFPVYFVQALVARLAAEFCLPLTESDSRAEFLYRRAELELRTARMAEARAATPATLGTSVLIDVRGGS